MAPRPAPREAVRRRSGSRASVAKPLVYVTEMVAFFEKVGRVQAQKVGVNGKTLGKPTFIHRAYNKRQFGIVHVRTDGERVLVATHSGRDDRKESYSFRVSGEGEISFGDTPE
jgi:hypothetical protein